MVPEPNCSRGHPTPSVFRFGAASGSVDKCLRHAVVHGPLLRNAVGTALLVGTVLTGINQGNVLANGSFPAELWWKIPLTYSVPYIVATTAALRISAVH